MKKILITGGSGTVGSSFIRKYRDEFQFYNYSRNEAAITELIREFSEVKSYIGDVDDYQTLVSVFNEVQPDIVIHAAALKHVNLAEENPIATVKANINGSLNIIRASQIANVPLTIGISSDKACAAENTYGYSKAIMEQMFLKSFTEKNKFVICRFANVAHSNGSVLPYWLDQAKKQNQLKVTDPEMNRLMFTKDESATLIYKSIEKTNSSTKPFIFSKLMKSVNILELAKVISDLPVEVVGPRPGEKMNETLINKNEMRRATTTKDSYIMVWDDVNTDENLPEYSSATAEFMTTSELLELINNG